MPIPPKIRSLLRPALTLAVAAGTIVLIVALWRAYMLAPWTRDGRVGADVVQVMPDVSGRVAEVRVVDNQRVRRGDILYVIDRARFRLAVDAAAAELRARRAELALKTTIARRHDRLGSEIIAAEAIDRADGEARMAQAATDAAAVALATARLDLARATVTAPVDGYATHVRLRPGDYATAGATRIAIVDAHRLWVTGYFEETKLARIAQGARAEVRLMGYDAPLRGHVESIGRGIADPNDSPDGRGLPSVDPVFTWVRLAQRIPVRVQIDRVPPGLTLAAGMTCSVAIGDGIAYGRLLAATRTLL